MSAESLARPSDAPVYAEATIRFNHPDAIGATIYEGQREDSTLVYDPHLVKLLDARRASPPPRLDTHGFELVKHPYRFDQARLPRRVGEPGDNAYGQEIARLLRRLTGATKVMVFHQSLRDEANAIAAKPHHSAHIDFDRQTLESFVRGVSGPDADRLLAKRFSNINLWRGLRPVERSPLAVCQGNSMAPSDLVPGRVQYRKNSSERPKSGFNIAYSPGQRWWIYPQMQPDELLLMRLFDSDPSRVQTVAHSAVKDPLCRPDAPPRRSLEVRTLAFYD